MNALETFIAGHPFGFVTEKDLPELIRLGRLLQCLVRCGGCRFICAAQDVAHLIKCIEAGGDYVRDVSLTASEIANASAWRPENSHPRPLIATRAHGLQPPHTAARLSNAVQFNEADCGGAFDGRQVTSDADPGL